ncbi:pyrroline-5-carboxylate reductase family protein [Brevundimonas sp.]|uniref:pyrroline-5-carboxylate reductase family protein n=1 Tax=Brevundimonas sp. TaxID=1871086 RepID=UPI003A1012D4
MHISDRPIILLGCGRLGSALLEGWLASRAVDPARLIVLTPSAKPAAEAARERGARINPSTEVLGEAATLVLAVKPGLWREASGPVVSALAVDATVVSLMAGVRAHSLSAVFGTRPIARVMPTTAVAQGRGVAAIWSDEEGARTVAHALFDPVADTVDLAEESLIDAATAVAGSAPAFIHAYVEALARAGQAAGLDAEAAGRLARGALRSAGAGAETGAPLSDLIARIASPGGTTEAGLKAQAAAGLDAVAMAAVQAAVARAGELGS